MKNDVPNSEDAVVDETTMTEISIFPDGRIYVFGASRQILAVLHDLNPLDARLGRLLAQIGSGVAVGAAESASEQVANRTV